MNRVTELNMESYFMKVAQVKVMEPGLVQLLTINLKLTTILSNASEVNYPEKVWQTLSELERIANAFLATKMMKITELKAPDQYFNEVFEFSSLFKYKRWEERNKCWQCKRSMQINLCSQKMVLLPVTLRD